MLSEETCQWCLRKLVACQNAPCAPRDNLAPSDALRRAVPVEHPEVRHEIARLCTAYGWSFRSQFADDLRGLIDLAAVRSDQIAVLVEALQAVLASAHPNSSNHPAMFAAWNQARAALQHAGVTK